MIYRNSTDPVFLKKIQLKVWLLRDEIEEVIKKRLNLDDKDIQFDDLVEEYQQHKAKLTLIKNDDGKDEAVTEESQVDSEEKEASAEESSGPEVISQRTPQIINEKLANGKTILTEVYMDRMFFFSDRPFVEGQSVVIKFCVPKTFIVNADVLYSQAYSAKNRIISQNRLPYRVCVVFSFLKKGERTLLRQFLSCIEFEETRPKNMKLADKEEKNSEKVTEHMFEEEKDAEPAQEDETPEEQSD